MKDQGDNRKDFWLNHEMPRRGLFKLLSLAGGMVAAWTVLGKAGGAESGDAEGKRAPGPGLGAPGAGASDFCGNAGARSFLRYEEARPEQMRVMLKESPVAYIPFGALEWHGEHGPLGLDGLKAHCLCEAAASRTGGVVFPAVYWGAFDTVRFPFTFNFSQSGMQELVRESLVQIDDWGFRFIMLLTGHYPPSFQKLLREECRLHNKTGKTLAMGAPEQVFATDIKYLGDHAGMWETSIMMAMHPELIDLSRMPKGLSAPERYKQYGVMGEDPAEKASPELGRMAIAHIADKLAKLVEETLQQGNDDAIEKAYADYEKALTIPAEIKAMDLHNLDDMVRYGIIWAREKP